MASLSNISVSNIELINVYPKDSNRNNIPTNYVLQTTESGLATWTPSRENPFTIDDILDISAKAAANEQDISNIEDSLQNIYIDSNTVSIGIDANGTDQTLNDSNLADNIITIGYQTISNLSERMNQDGSIAIGHHSLRNESNYQPIDGTGIQRSNIAIGYNTGNDFGGGYKNIMFGYESGKVLKDASANILIGNNTGKTIQNGNSNIIIGIDAANDCSSDLSHSTIIGIQAASSFSGQGSYNTFIGENVANDASDVSNSIAIGRNNIANAMDISESIFIGENTGRYSIKNHNSISIGNNTTQYGTHISNIVIGINSIKGKTDGTNSNNDIIAIGTSIGISGGDGGDSNIIIGNLAGFELSNNENVIIGHSAGMKNGGCNVYIGYEVAKFIPTDTANSNVGIGHKTLRENEGTEMIAIGANAATLKGLTQSIAIGKNAGKGTETGLITSSSNIFIGENAGSNIGGGGSIGIGINSLSSVGNGYSNNIAIGVN
jgi:hypothetical protein